MLNAIIPSTALLPARVARHLDMHVVDLAQGLGLLPVSDESPTYRNLCARPTSVNTPKVDEDHLHIKHERMRCGP